MSTIAKMTLIGLYNYDNHLFDLLELPSGVDKDTFITSLLLSEGEKCVAYTNPSFFKEAVGVWGRKWQHTIERVNYALTEEYNPTHNYDRYEEWKDTNSDTSSTKVDGTASSTGKDWSKVSAFNDLEYQPDRFDESENSSKSGSTGSATNTGKSDHSGHMYGNIGVTTAMQMILEELNLRESNNIYDIMAKLFSRDLLLYVW